MSVQLVVTRVYHGGLRDADRDGSLRAFASQWNLCYEGAAKDYRHECSDVV